MKKLMAAHIRIPLMLLLTFGAIEYFVDSGDQLAIVKYPKMLGVLALVFFALLFVEIIVESFKYVDDRLTYEGKDTAEDRGTAYQKFMRALTGAKSIEQEHTLELDHEYDGIRELDNDLPPWWTSLFYIGILFGTWYFLYYNYFGGPSQVDEYHQQNTEALLAIQEYKKNNPDLVNADNVTLLTDAASLEAGKATFMSNCIACHLADGGGSVGPNLTDEYWILGGGIKNVFNTISEGGREGKGMIPWKSQLEPTQIQQVASYVLSLQGTKPANPKAPEGDIWKE
ncbi:MAG: cbb3-type cytochrome c oxidase N-terminal domain-containing protein [Bacteroidota bacterium]|nr:cbb3-type cytochrome c oxidase N-terminal domain-containing protein [Bacteroidota bacterium]